MKADRPTRHGTPYYFVTDEQGILSLHAEDNGVRIAITLPISNTARSVSCNISWAQVEQLGIDCVTMLNESGQLG
jgi:hypothetical protein